MKEVVDTHLHVFVPGLPLTAVRRYVPDYAATAEDYRVRMAATGVTHGVLIQPSFLGTDNSFMCQVLRTHRAIFRGIAVVDPEVSVAELDRLEASGVVGIRLNLDGLPLPRFDQGPWPSLLGELAQRDWQVELHRAAADLPALIEPLLAAGVKVVVDHFGRPDAALGVTDPDFRYLLSQGASGRVWVKLSAAYRNGWGGARAHEAVDASAALLASFGADRLVWASDWPHTRHETLTSIEQALQELEQWVPDADARATILGPSALSLFGF